MTIRAAQLLHNAVDIGKIVTVAVSDRFRSWKIVFLKNIRYSLVKYIFPNNIVPNLICIF